MVITPIEGGPSERLGVMSGDRIVQVEDEVTAGVGVTNKDVIRLLKDQRVQWSRYTLREMGLMSC